MQSVKINITFKAHTDRIETREILCTRDFNVGDMVFSINNGLLFRVENNKMLRWMKEGGQYVCEVVVPLA